jgi:phenylalanyl-tRNA synthetase beta chain
MKISLKWLKSLIDIDQNADDIAAMLTRSGLEVEGVEAVEPVPGGLEGIVIGEVLTCERHPDADKLSKTTVAIGPDQVVPIVCGAPNVAAGQKVIVATVNAMLYPAEGEPFKIKKAKIRGEVSEGMICAEDEIGLGHSHAGIMVLDTDLPNGTPAARYFNLETDHVLEIGLTPNRADAASHLGVARDLKVLLGKPVHMPVAELPAKEGNYPIEVVIENPEACPRYSGITITGVTVKDSPDWLKARLLSIGLTPINNIVDTTNYLLHELGQPLHAFDADQVKGRKILVKNAAEGSTFTTLDEVERKLGAHNLMICNAEEPMAIAGVFGGVQSGVTEATRNIFIESAYFSPDSVRKTAQQHGLKTDASFRYERGTDPNITVYALKRAALLILEIAGGQIASDVIDVYPAPVEPFHVYARYKNIDRLIGKTLDRDFIQDTLEALDIRIIEKTEEGMSLEVPPYRVDVQREADITEELLRLYGYDNIELSEHLSTSYLADFPDTDRDKIQNRIAGMLAAAGFSEMMNNSLTTPEYSASPYLDEAQDVVILNKLSEDLGVMRQTLLFSGLEVLTYNINRRQKDLRMFEFGKVYRKIEGGYEENRRLSIFITGSRQPESWQHKTEKADFHQLASMVQMILQKMNAGAFGTEPTQDKLFAYGLTYTFNKRPVATLGQLDAKVAKLTDTRQAVFYADIDWDYLFKKYNTRLQAQELPKFPEVRRDLSLVIDKKVSFEDIRQLAQQTERKLLRAVNVFDVYEGDNIGKDKKSYSVSFILQDFQQTLTDQVIDKTMQRLMDAFESQLGAIIRK